MAESKRDYYEVLGVSKDADEATLKKAYRQVAKIRKNAVSMISLVMLLLTEVREQAADMADSTLTVLILATFSEISSEICSAADAEAVVRTRDR